jgi:hypothetical protein
MPVETSARGFLLRFVSLEWLLLFLHNFPVPVGPDGVQLPLFPVIFSRSNPII